MRLLPTPSISTSLCQQDLVLSTLQATTACTSANHAAALYRAVAAPTEVAIAMPHLASCSAALCAGSNLCSPYAELSCKLMSSTSPGSDDDLSLRLL